MKELKFNDLEPGLAKTVGAAGSSFIYVKEALNDVIIRIDNGQSLQVPEGGKLKLIVPIQKEFSIENTGTVGDFVLVVGVGDYIEPQIAGTVSVKPKNSLIGLSPVTFDVNAKTIAGNASRKELHIQSAASNTGVIYLGSTDGLTGIPIEPGQTVVVEISNDLSLYTDTINSVVNLCEVV